MQIKKGVCKECNTKYFSFENPVWKGCRSLVWLQNQFETWSRLGEIIWDRFETWKCLEKCLEWSQRSVRKKSQPWLEQKREDLSGILSQICPLASNESWMATGSQSQWMSGKVLIGPKKSWPRLTLFHIPDIIPDTFHCNLTVSYVRINHKTCLICHQIQLVLTYKAYPFLQPFILK